MAIIENLADMVGVTPQVFLITIAVLVVLFVIIYIKISLDEKKGVDSQEKAEIRKIITNLVPGGDQYTAAYAHSKEVYGGARISPIMCGWFPSVWRAERSSTQSLCGQARRM